MLRSLLRVLLVSLCVFTCNQFALAQLPAIKLSPATRPTSPVTPTNRNTAPPIEKSSEAESQEKDSTTKTSDAKVDAETKAEKITNLTEDELKQQLDAKPTPPKPEDAAEKAKREAAEKAKITKRLAKIKTLSFDRRVSTALKLWSAPKIEGSENEKSEGDGQDAVESAASKEKTDAQKLAEEDALFDDDLRLLHEHVTLSRWADVKSFIACFDVEISKAMYDQLLASLASGPIVRPNQPDLSNSLNVDPAILAAAMAAQGRGPGAQFKEKNFFSLSDVFGLIDAAPAKLEKTQIGSLGQIIHQTLTLGHDIDKLIERFSAESEKGGDGLLTKRQSALLLFSAGQELEAGKFLPTPEEAQQNDDREGLNLISRFAMAKYAQEKKTEFLEQAWSATQAALAAGKIEEIEKQEAMRRAVEIAPKIRTALGDNWLNESFTKRVERGKEILAVIGAGTSMAMQTYPTTPAQRLQGIQLQKTAVDSLLAAAPDKAALWKEQLMLLANNWLREAQFSYEQSKSTSLGPQMQRDVYGNYFYSNQSYNYNANRNGSPIEIPEMIESRPSNKWLSVLDESIIPRFNIMFAQLYLKVNEEEKAFPFIEQFAKEQPEKALELAEEFLRVWTTNHDPNATRNRTNYYMFSYGYNQRADGIPLTRSKQERNLTELSNWVGRLRALPIGELDEELLVRAFTTSHSRAEVYRVESLEEVFGAIESLEAKTLAEMVQTMRGNLAGVWRNPAMQKENNTNRRKADMEAEVLRGYRVAHEVLEKGRQKYPDDWRLILAKASILHDENDYQQELQNSSGFAERRNQAMELFKNAAETYAAHVSELSEEEETTKAYELWYYASLGAVDLGQIRKTDEPDLRQMEFIRQSLHAIPAPAGERHIASFANSLFTRMSAIKPELKFRYLRTGFEIIGDHKSANEAQKVYQYYKDLVTEIKLESKIDGGDEIGYKQPFGVWVNLVHTKEIERESGGFSKYLQNQNNSYYSYNYGRPTENYRDKFQEAATKTLSEKFEVLSVTFNDPKTTSSALPKYGWRVTPYAYILLKPRGPEVDRIPPLQMDLDFLDTSGYAIIPIESASIPIDATKEKSDVRPYKNLKVVQTLDERQSDEGKLILELKATCNGLAPDLDEITKISLDEFEVVKIEDENVSVTQFDQDLKETAILSERVWMVTLKAKEGLAEKPTTFTFPTAANEGIDIVHRRYVDADLEEVDGSISLVATYGKPRSTWPWIVAAAIAVSGLLMVVWLIPRRRTHQTVDAYQRLPAEINAFTVIGFLKQIQLDNGMNEAKKVELAESINKLERHYFAGKEQSEVDLRKIAETWLRQSA